jgi:hypothetical protein
MYVCMYVCMYGCMNVCTALYILPTDILFKFYICLKIGI